MSLPWAHCWGLSTGSLEYLPSPPLLISCSQLHFDQREQQRALQEATHTAYEKLRSQMLQESSEVRACVQEQSTRIQESFLDIQGLINHSRQQQLQAPDQLRTLVGTINGAIDHSLAVNEERWQASSLDTTRMLGPKIEEMKEMSSKQYQDMNQLLLQIQQSISTSPHIRQSCGSQADDSIEVAKAVASTQTDIDESSHGVSSKSMVSLVQRLSSMIATKPVSSRSEKAQEIIQDLKELATLLLEKQLSNSDTIQWSRIIQRVALTNSQDIRFHNAETGSRIVDLLTLQPTQEDKYEAGKPLLRKNVATDRDGVVAIQEPNCYSTNTTSDPGVSNKVLDWDNCYIKIAYEVWAPCDSLSSRAIMSSLPASSSIPEQTYDVLRGKIELLPKTKKGAKHSCCWRCRPTLRHCSIPYFCLRCQRTFYKEVLMDTSKIYQLALHRFNMGSVIFCAQWTVYKVLFSRDFDFHLDMADVGRFIVSRLIMRRTPPAQFF